jgi:hypothetical protein
MRFLICTLHNIKSDLFMGDEMDGVCSTYGGDEKCIHNSVGKPEERRLLGRS